MCYPNTVYSAMQNVLRLMQSICFMFHVLMFVLVNYIHPSNGLYHSLCFTLLPSKWPVNSGDKIGLCAALHSGAMKHQVL